MLDVTIDEIQRDLVKYLRQVEAGETLVIIQADKPIAELRPIANNKRRRNTQLVQQVMEKLNPVTNDKRSRPFGLCAGEFTVPDDFDAPLPEDIFSAFEGK